MVVVVVVVVVGTSRSPFLASLSDGQKGNPPNPAPGDENLDFQTLCKTEQRCSVGKESREGGRQRETQERSYIISKSR